MPIWMETLLSSCRLVLSRQRPLSAITAFKNANLLSNNFAASVTGSSQRFISKRYTLGNPCGRNIRKKPWSDPYGCDAWKYQKKTTKLGMIQKACERAGKKQGGEHESNEPFPAGRTKKRPHTRLFKCVPCAQSTCINAHVEEGCTLTKGKFKYSTNLYPKKAIVGWPKGNWNFEE